MSETTTTTTTGATETPAAEVKTETPSNIMLTDSQTGEMTLSPEALAMMSGDSGKQKFGVRELLVPVLKICNTTSGYMKKSDQEYIKAAEEGDFIDTLTLTLRKGPIRILVVRFETTYIEAKPKMGPTVKVWGTDRSGYNAAVGGDVGVRITKDGNEIREVGSYYCLLLNDDGTSLPCMMYLGSTSWKEARRLNALLGSLELPGPNGLFTAPNYARMYSATSVPATDGQNTWMTWHFGMGPMTLMTKFGMALYKKAKAFEESIDRREVRVQGEMDDERKTETQARAAAPAQQQGGPPPNDAPPPASEEEYYANSGSGPDRAQSTIVDKAKTAPF